ncbi:putative capsid protein [Camel associated drosmacovirus 2]|uniref:Putative capsid protein n=1 Tax=Camel associated drosmacovirus 2 TaxID=2169877 RepID=A0A0A1EL96_9VIRU|nr:putative capsid protein [Camel associated drosmacovirus 2]AIY31258.1 putative capsid protein [Camel associated drosmacovirus 2]
MHAEDTSVPMDAGDTDTAGGIDMVTVRYTETYDLCTEVGKLGIIGIHTPTLSNLEYLYRGLMMNHRYVHLDGCDVVIACASTLPADPLQVGTEAGDVAPQDMFNPILYKAVSNDSFNTVINRVTVGSSVLDDEITGGSVRKVGDAFADLPQLANAPERVYYGLLADPDGWKKAMPQAGLEMRGLYPIVHTIYSTYGQQTSPGSNPDAQSLPYYSDAGQRGSANREYYLRGNSVRLPRLPLCAGTQSSGASGDQLPVVTIPTTYVACLVMPPAKLHKFYYRMRVTWTITFSEVVPLTEWENPTRLWDVGTYVYKSDYDEQSKRMDTTESTVDAKDTTLERIMTAGK